MRIAVVGTGALARAVCDTLALSGSGDLRVRVVGRDGDRAAAVAFVARTLAHGGGPGRPEFTSASVARLDQVGPVSDLLDELDHDLVVCCASLSSTWEAETNPSAWTELISGTGFGIALPLHAIVPLTLAEALRATGSAASLLNACYPDAVNPILAARGLGVLGGLGNAATIALAVQTGLGLADQERIHVLAHHRHLYEPSGPDAEARVWLDDRPVPDVGALLRPLRTAGRQNRYAMIGVGAARLVAAMGGDVPVRLHVPGPLGLVGGYPVVVKGRTLEPSLPDGVTMDEARAVNDRAAAEDGVVVGPDGRVRLSPRAARQVKPHLPEMASGFAAAEVHAIGARLLALRGRLRELPPGGG
ncbi:hypothetical protein OHR68_20815 [Spirillospora sp. NBC_00431]